MSLQEKINASRYDVLKRIDPCDMPKIGIIAGTGLDLTANMDVKEVSYNYISNFPKKSGAFGFGKLGGKNVVVMNQRMHYYEGFSLKEIAFPVRLMRGIGCHTLIVTNAAGGLNTTFEKGDIMVIEDHINLIGSPLRGKHYSWLGERFPDMSGPYNIDLITKVFHTGRLNGIFPRSGTYVGVPGPQLETRAEYRMLRQMGADAVGMSTVPEVIAAVHCGMKVLGLSVITDLCDPDNLSSVSVAEIVKTAKLAEPKLRTIILELMKELPCD